MEEQTFIIELASYEKPEIIEDSREEWVEYYMGGERAYDWLIDRYHNSPTNNACINTIGRLIYGRGIHAKDASRKPNEYASMKSLLKPEVLRFISETTKMLGAGYFQCIFNKQHTKVIKVHYFETNLIQPEKCNKDGEVEAFYYSNNWEDTKKYPPKRIPAFGTSKEEIEILEVRKKAVGMKYFTPPDYEGCLPYAVLEEEIADYLINHVQNGFSGTKVVNFNNGIPSEEQMRIQANKVKANLTGSKGDPIIVAFNKNAEEKTTVDDIPLDDAPQHYEFLSKECRDKILNCHSVTSSMLVGIQVDGNGFSSTADEIEVASRFFYNQAVKPTQDLILDAVEKILAFNGISLDLYFKRLNLMEEVDDKEQKQEQIQEVKFESHLEGFLQGVGEVVNEDEWELVDERDVDYDLEDDFDSQLREYANELLPKQSLLSRIFKGTGTGTARPNASSQQDAEIDGFFFKVRYEYVGNETPERPFCKAMMNANKVYRKEDILQMDSHIVNPGHGHNDEKYSIWLYKGGVNCEHKWRRKTYVSTTRSIDVNNPNANTVSTNKARKFGYRVNNEKEVSMKPKDMPRNGHHPAYTE